MSVDREGQWTSLRTAWAAMLIGILAGIAALAASRAWSAGFSGADEPAHFLNTYFIASYVQTAFGSDPLAFAAEYYLHYPKISIGHWPPAYYGLLSPLFLLFPASSSTAFAANLLVCAVPPVLVALLVNRLYGAAAGLAGAAACALTPIAIEGVAFFMLDQPVAGLALAATMMWIEYARQRTKSHVFAFAILAAAAVLVKGNGWLLVFVPPLHIALTNRWHLLRRPTTWLAALLAGAIVGPWYFLTAGIASDGFNYQPGLAYAAEALRFNVSVLAAMTAVLGLAAAGAGIAAAWLQRQEWPQQWDVVAGCVSLLAATLLLQSLVPVDLDARYMAPALPPLIVLALAGVHAISARFAPRRRGLALASILLVLTIPGMAHLASREPKLDVRMAEAAAAILRDAAASRQPVAWVVDGSSGAEGAFIAAMAVRDPRLENYTIRSSKLLARSDFMGNEYALVTADPAEVLARLRQLGVKGVVVSRSGNAAAFPHGAVLRRALREPSSPYRLTATLPHRNRAGVTEIYSSRVAAHPNVAAIRAMGLPEKAQTLAAKSARTAATAAP